VEDVFEQKGVVDREMVDHVYDIVQQKLKVLSVIGLARAAQQQNLKDSLHRILAPVLLIWGLQDRVTPPEVAEQFKALLPNARLHYLNNCGHAPMMEHPELFNDLVNLFLEEPHHDY
jgi:pimeloyl-ACP methyl ester carboxylesterase